MTTRFGWSAVAVLGAGVLLAAPAALANEGAKGRSSASGHMGHDSTASGEKESSGTGSDARGSGQAGTSTGARPGEVTGAAGAAETDADRSARRASAAEGEISGKVEKYDREKRTLSLADSEKKLKVTDDTEVIKDGAKVSPGQIMEGDEIRASFSGSGDELEVLTLEVGAGSPAPEAGAGAGSIPAPPATGGTDEAAGASGDASGSTGTKSPVAQ